MEMKPPNMSAVRRFRATAMKREGASGPRRPDTQPDPGLKVATWLGRGGAAFASGTRERGGVSGLGGGA